MTPVELKALRQAMDKIGSHSARVVADIMANVPDLLDHVEALTAERDRRQARLADLHAALDATSDETGATLWPRDAKAQIEKLEGELARFRAAVLAVENNGPGNTCPYCGHRHLVYGHGTGCIVLSARGPAPAESHEARDGKEEP